MKHRRDLVHAELVAYPLTCLHTFRSASEVINAEVLANRFRSRAQALGVHRLLERHVDFAYHSHTTVFSLLAAAGESLTIGNDGPALKNSEPEDILAWRWMSLALPASLLVAARWAREASTRLPNSRCIAPRLDSPKTPKRRVAHLHQHAGAAAPFELVWSYMAGNLCLRRIHESTPSGWNSEHWQTTLAAALLVRRALWARWNNLPTMGLRHLADAESVLDDPTRCSLFVARRHQWALAARLRSDKRRAPRLTTLESAWEQDPLSVRSMGDWGEGEFLVRGFRHVASDSACSDDRRRFLQILRIKTMLFRHLVADVCEEGLGAFTRKYKNMSPYRGALDTIGVEVGSRGRAVDLKAVEVRTKPPKTTAELLDMVSVPGMSTQQASDLDWSWTLHLIRDRHAAADPAAKPSTGVVSRVGVGAQQRHAKKVAARLKTSLRQVPQLLRVIRGLDVASDEVQGPMWLSTSYVHDVRAESIRIAKLFPTLQPLRATVHAGEDYGHAITGLRQVDELRLWKVLGRGDRIGHAISIGEDHRMSSSGEPQPRWEALLDAAWLRTAHRWSSGTTDHLNRFVADQANELRLLEWAPAWSRMHRRLGAAEPSKRPQIANLQKDFEAASTTDAWHQTVLPRWPDEVLQELPALQRRIIRDLQLLNVSIELNPSSNLLIGGLRAPVHQPGWMTSGTLDFSISADDPLMLATDIDDEYAYAHAGLRLQERTGLHFGSISADEFCRKSAEASCRVSFGLPRSTWGPAPRLIFARQWRSPKPW